jgi:hypothetical protein
VTVASKLNFFSPAVRQSTGLVDQGRIPTYRVGAHLRFQLEEVLGALREEPPQEGSGEE